MSSAASQTSRIVHWPTSSGGSNWQSALTNFARLPNPSKTTLPSGVYLRSNSYTLTIFDGYPKSKFHFLILPRMPFWLEESTKATRTTSTDETTTQQNQDQEINGKSPPSSSPPNSHTLSLTKGGKLSFGNQLKGSIVPNSHLSNLTSLIYSPHASFVLNKLREESENVIKLIKEEMVQTPFPNSNSSTKTNVEWGIRVGFHAVPSMSTVHLHVISDDLVSECLKNKKHYQSFHPTHGFWLDLDYVENLVNEGKKSLPQSEYHYEKLLKHPLVSFRDGQMYGNIPKLKAHLEQAWIDDINQRRKVKSATSTVAGNKHELDEAEYSKGKSKSIKT